MKSRRRNREVGEFVVVDVRARVPLSSVKKKPKGKRYIYIYIRIYALVSRDKSLDSLALQTRDPSRAKFTNEPT